MAIGRRVAGAIRSLVNARDGICSLSMLSCIKQEVDERIGDGVLRWIVERMENDRIAKSVYIGNCSGNLSLGVGHGRDELIP